jgi:hypothetical protein
LERNFDLSHKKNKETGLDGRDPVIVGSFTEWQPKKMWKLVDFLQECGPLDERITDETMLNLLKKQELESQKGRRNAVPPNKNLYDESLSVEERMKRLTDYQRGKMSDLR